MSRVLIVEDERSIRVALRRILTQIDCEVIEAEDGVDAQAKLTETAFDLVITDLCMPRADGFAVLHAARQLSSPPPVVILTGHGTAADSVRALRAGAIDFMSKPFHPDELRRVVAGALQSGAHPGTGSDAPSTAADSPQAVLIGDSPELRAMLAQVERVAEADTTALLFGERHTGKPAVARLLHALSPRAGGPLIVVDCSASPSDALAGALFGSGSDAGALSRADGGTLVLTELQRLDPELRARVLSGLREQRARDGGNAPLDVRLVIDVERAPETEAHAADVVGAAHAALGGVVIHVPSIRERSDDVPLLIEHFVELASRGLDRPINAQMLLTTLGSYAWPGNLKELETRIARFVTAPPPEPNDERAEANAFVVPVERLAAVLVLHDGSRHEVSLPYGPGLPVDSLFESKEPFVPVREHGTTQIYARAVLAALSVTAGNKPEQDDGLPRSQRAVRVHLQSGAILEGELRYVHVAGRTRVTDVLNEPSPSFALYQDDLIHYVAKAHVARVEEC